MTASDRPVRQPRTWCVGSAVLIVLTVALLAVGKNGPGSVIIPIVIVASAIAVTTWTIVRSRQRRLEYEARLTAWAAERAAHDERLRIARELHDIVSHGLGLIIVRAAAARLSEAEHEQSLADIEHAGREAVAELRRMLTVLRDSADAPLRPVQSLADLPGVVEAARSAGLDPRLDVGELGEVSQGAQATACAVVREAIANTSRRFRRLGARLDRHVTTLHDLGRTGRCRDTCHS